jgi:folate-binding protein YgfZ
MTDHTLTGYEAAHQRAAYALRDDYGFFELKGSDRLDFIQRQSTNDLNQLNDSQAVTTVLTSATARILDVLTIIPQAESYLVLSLPGRSTQSYLKSRIFFMDKVTLTDRSDAYTLIDLIGPQAAAHLAEVGFTPPTGDHTFTPGQGGYALSMSGYGGTTYRLVVPAEGQQALITALQQVGAAPLDAPTRDALRVESGQPGPELSEDYTPLEVGLGAYISDTKGCYTGQEIIARQVTYDKVAKLLVRLTAEGPAEVGQTVYAGDSKMGEITSVAQLPGGGWLGLAVVRTRYLDDDLTTVHIGEGRTPAALSVVSTGGQHFA